MSTTTPLPVRPAEPAGIVPYPGPPMGTPPERRASAPATTSRRGGALALLAGMAAIAALVPLREIWPVRLAILALLLTVPGLTLLRAVRAPRLAVAATPCTA